MYLNVLVRLLREIELIYGGKYIYFIRLEVREDIKVLEDKKFYFRLEK